MDSLDSNTSSFRKKPLRFATKVLHGTAIMAILSVAALILSVFAENAEATRQAKTESERITIPLGLPLHTSETELATSAKTDDSAATNALTWQNLEVKRGDTLSSLLGGLGVDNNQIYAINLADKETKMLRRLNPGQLIEVNMNAANQVDKLIYRLDEVTGVVYQRENDDFFSVTIDTKKLESRIAVAFGTIQNSLFESAAETEMPDSIAMELANIFGWDIDFAMDIRSGDTYSVMYEEFYADNKKVRNGSIIAAEFVNGGNSFQAVRYTDDEGNSSYYTPDGRSMRKAFLRTPVDFSRISSRFGKRLHPTLNTIRQHKGVDYAAPRGTPVKSAGDGRVIFRGVKGGYGKTIVVEHGSSYRTLYAHLNEFGSRVRNGTYVKQGQIIGFVGSTGRATGSHLHYEFQVNGSHRNPLTVKLPDASPIASRYRADFLDHAQKLVAQLAAVRSTNTNLSAL